jgi:colanic acid biosynthesis glycosyl transferase WcaI
MSKGSLPSKSYSILASGRPIIASVDQDSDMARLVSRAEAGICLPPEEPALLSKAVLELKNDPSVRRKFGENGRSYAIKHHSPQAAARHFEDLLKSVVH